VLQRPNRGIARPVCQYHCVVSVPPKQTFFFCDRFVIVDKTAIKNCPKAKEKSEMNSAYTTSDRNNPLISMDEVASLLQVGRQTVRRYVASGVLPPPITLSPKVVLWPRKTIEEVLRLTTER